MTNIELLKLQNALEAKRAELIARLRGQVGELTIDDGQPELIDRIQCMSHRDVTAVMLNRYSATLAEVECALRAIAEDSYGTCMLCDDPIALRRLQSIPWACYCVRCQEKIEAEQRGSQFYYDTSRAA